MSPEALKYHTRLSTAMVNLFPPKRYWFPLVLGAILTFLLAFVISFVAPFVVALLLAFVVPGPGGKLRKFFMFLFYLYGALFLLVGVLVILGSTILGIAALSALTLATGWVLGVILIVIGIVLFIIGNFIAD